MHRTAALAILLTALSFRAAMADEPAHAPSSPSPLAELQAAKDAVTAQEYELRYRFTPGEVLRWNVVHLVTLETKIQGSAQTARTRSVATKAWKVLDVDEKGNITLTHTIEDVDMWQNVTDKPEVRYNSKKDTKAPEGYEHVASSIGRPLARITIDPRGRIIERENLHWQYNPGLGELTMPLPKGPVKIGQRWNLPEQVPVRDAGGQVKRIHLRQLYTLTDVAAGVATIEVKTQVLSPVDDPRIRSQLVQRLQFGTIRFDVDAGRVLSKQMDTDEIVIGFQGADSIMQYLARFTEEPVEASNRNP
jgi:hypothetical protein